MVRTIFFDAVGTLFSLTRSVGHHYALVGSEIGLTLDAEKLDRAFSAVWRSMPPREAIDGPREDDDKGWWRELVNKVLDQVDPDLSPLDRDNFFEIAYEHFAEAGVWEAYPESEATLEMLQPGAVVSGTVKNLTDYGAFIDLGGIDGLLHVTDISYGRVTHPAEVLHVGDEISVMVLKTFSPLSDPS